MRHRQTFYEKSAYQQADWASGQTFCASKGNFMKPTIREAIIVEGKYDKNTVAQAVNATIIETDGFGIFSNKEKMELIRRIAGIQGVIIFTDGDGAGTVIRGYLKGALPIESVKHAYIPDIYGKERRKRAPSKEGKLGVEGMDRQTVVECLRRAGATFLEDGGKMPEREKITKADLYMLGLSGASGSANKRKMLVEALGFPERISANELLNALNILYSLEELKKIIDDLNKK